MQNIDENVLYNLIGHAREGMEKAAQIRKEAATVNAKTAQLIPSVVQALADNAYIRDSEMEKCAELLQNPVNALQLMLKVANHDNSGESRVHRMGKPAPVKTASAKGSQADAVFFSALGLE